MTAVAGRLAAAQRIMGALRSGPLAVPSFRLLAGGQFASTIGDFCYAVALPWLVLSTHGGAILLGIVLACYGVPRTVLIPVGGVLADKVGPRTLMLAADAARCVLVAVLALLAAGHTASLAALGPIAALIGAGEGLFIPASFAIMPSLLDEERLTAGNALSTAAVQAGSLLGPALGGALVAATHASTAAFAVDAASFAVSALTLLMIPRRAVLGSVAAAAGHSAGAAAAPDGAAPGRGGRHARQRAGAAAAVAGAAGHPGGGHRGQPGQRRNERRRTARAGACEVRAAGDGALLACFAVGGVIGTLTAARCGNLRRPALFAAMIFLPEAAAICLVPYVGGETGAAVLLFVTGASTVSATSSSSACCRNGCPRPCSDG